MTVDVFWSEEDTRIESAPQHPNHQNQTTSTPLPIALPDPFTSLASSSPTTTTQPTLNARRQFSVSMTIPLYDRLTRYSEVMRVSKAWVVDRALDRFLRGDG